MVGRLNKDKGGRKKEEGKRRKKVWDGETNLAFFSDRGNDCLSIYWQSQWD
jgi:hypothetical protein